MCLREESDSEREKPFICKQSRERREGREKGWVGKGVRKTETEPEGMRESERRERKKNKRENQRGTEKKGKGEEKEKRKNNQEEEKRKRQVRGVKRQQTKARTRPGRSLR